MQNYYYKHPFRWILNFYTFLSSFNSCFFPYLYSLHHVLSYNLIHIHICRPKQAESCVGRTKEEWIQGYEWRAVALVTHRESYSLGSHSPALLCAHQPQVCHDHGRYFGQGNLSRGDMSLPNGSIIFCPTSWNADVMTGAWGAMLDQR